MYTQTHIFHDQSFAQEVRMDAYTLYSTSRPGHVIGKLRKGKALNSANQPWVAMDNLISQIKRGLVEKEIPITAINDDGKKEPKTIQQLFAPRIGNKANLKPIKPESRFKGRDWLADKTEINRMLGDGHSIRQIAKHLGVSASALSKANKTHNLYDSRDTPIRQSLDI